MITFYPFLPWIRNVSVSRKIIAALLLLIALPWGEWLQTNFAFSRMDWSRQIFQHVVLIYILGILFRAFKSFWQRLYFRFINLLDRVASNNIRIWIPCLFFFLLSSWISLYVYDRTLMIQDSAAHLFQAKIFLQGKFFAPAPAVPDFFSVEGDMLVLRNGKWFGMYLPGFAAILAAAITIHAQWIICPLMGALTIVIWVMYVKRWYDPRTALLVSIICALSPFLLLMSSTIMIHTPELLIVSAAIYLLRNEVETPSWWSKTLLGLILATGITLRGFSILATIAPMTLYLLYAQPRNRRLSSLILIGFSMMVGGFIVAFFQLKTTGNPFLPGYLFEYKQPVIYGFGKTIAHQIFTPLRGLENTSNEILGLDYWLSGWYVGSHIFLIFFVLFCQCNTWDRLMVASCFTLLIFYYFSPFQDLVIGPRYLYPIALILLLFVVRSIVNPISTENQSFPFLIFLFCFLSFLMLRLPEFIYKYQPQKMGAGALKSAMTKTDREPKIVFLEKNISQQFVNWNDPWLREPIILVRDLGAQNEIAIKTFSDRKPLYFGLKFDLSPGAKKSKDNGYAFRQERTHKADGSVSLMQVALAMNVSNEYRDQDFFDQGLSIFRDGSSSVDQMKFLNEEQQRLQQKNDRTTSFRKGLIHTSRMMVLLKQFYEQSIDWSSFPFNDFRENNAEAKNYFAQAAEPGKQLIRALDKVDKRIDRNTDASLSNDEIKQYLQAKVQILQVSDW
ncbi:glycosyltransferase family 39 protein [bacterium]|nr:glycosyltransferase family 39 protein [bacterium]